MATITEDYVSFETAKLLKEKGFPQNPYICNTAYTLRGKLSNNAKSFVLNFDEFDKCGIKPITYSMAPTLQMAMKWLRKIHHIHIRLINSSDESYRYEIYPREGKYRSGCFSDRHYYETYEEAAEEAIKYCLEKLI